MDRAAGLHRRIAYVPGDVSLWPNLTGGQAIDLLSRLRGGAIDKAAYARASSASSRCSSSTREEGARVLEGQPAEGRAHRGIRDPGRLYLLDEPTSGLDPLMEQVFNREIAQVTADGATVLLSSHILSEVEELCDRVTIIREGKTVETGTMAELRHLTRTEVAFVHDRQEAAIAAIHEAHDLVVDSGRVRFTVDSDRVAGCCLTSPGCRCRASRSRRRRSRSSSCATTATSSPRSRGGAGMNRLLVLLRQRLRRDRLQLALWLVGTALLAYASVSRFSTLTGAG